MAKAIFTMSNNTETVYQNDELTKDQCTAQIMKDMTKETRFISLMSKEYANIALQVDKIIDIKFLDN